MGRIILKYGAVAGLIVGCVLFATGVGLQGRMPMGAAGIALGYLTMLVALSLVFVGIKRHRDVDRGGVIRFWPAFGTGLGISLVASVFYVLAWEGVLAVVHADFAQVFVDAALERARAKGMSGAEFAQYAAGMESFKAQYANPLYRLPMTFVEIFPVGLLVSLVSAALLRDPRFMPARPAAG